MLAPEPPGREQPSPTTPNMDVLAGEGSFLCLLPHLRASRSITDLNCNCPTRPCRVSFAASPFLFPSRVPQLLTVATVLVLASSLVLLQLLSHSCPHQRSSVTSMGEDSLGDWLHSSMRWSTQAQHGSVASLCCECCFCFSSSHSRPCVLPPFCSYISTRTSQVSLA